MDQQAIHDTAVALESLLIRYAPAHDVAAALLKSLRPFLDQAKAGMVLQPVDRQRIPGARTFDETDARTLPGLEDAFARFRTEMSGGEPIAQRIFRERHRLT